MTKERSKNHELRTTETSKNNSLRQMNDCLNVNKIIKKIIILSGLLTAMIFILGTVNVTQAQVDSGIKRIATYNPSTYYGASPLAIGETSGNGRFLVFESNKDIATFNPRNADENWELFLMDYAQRHIFQLTNTKHALANPNGSPTDQANIRVLITNLRPSISNDGKWIAFVSNATTSISTATPNGTNPGNFDGNSPGVLQILQQDGNAELWLYGIPDYQPVDLSSGDVPQFTDLGTGVFTQATNTPALYPPSAGTTSQPPLISVDSENPSINDDGSTVAFISNRDITGENSAPDNDNDEVFIYKRLSNITSQVTRTPRVFLSYSIRQRNPSISGDGSRVAFQSNAINPIVGMTGGSNSDFSQEIYLAELNLTTGVPNGIKRQITNSTIDTFDLYTYISFRDRSISRDGRYVILYSKAKLDSDNSSATSPAAFLFDCSGLCLASNTNFRQIGPRFNDDSAIPYSNGGGLYSVLFTDYNSIREPGSLVFESRMNFRSDGTVPPVNSSEGLNPLASRPRQIFAYSISAMTSPFSRLTNSQNIDWGIGARIIPSNTKEKINFLTLRDTNWSSLSIFHLSIPTVLQEDNNAQLNFFTGASSIPIGSSQAQGLTPNMLGSVVYSSSLVNYQGGFATNVTNSRNFAAPIQLKGVSLFIDGIAAGLTRAHNGRINFIVPSGIIAGNKSVVINHNGVIIRGNVQIVESPQPDVVTNFTETTPGPNGRARILNVTDPNNPLPEPFRTTTQTPSGTLPTKLRLFLTGVGGVDSNSITIRIGNVTVPNATILTNAVESDYPGVFTFDFTMPSQLNGVGNVPVVVTVNGQSSRPDSSAPRVNILSSQISPTDLAIWRPGNGNWWILDNYGATSVNVAWGANNDDPAPGDYDGDGKTDFCIFRKTEGIWWILKSSNFSYSTHYFGLNGDKVAPADYDGDGKTDIAVFRPSDSNWYILQSSNNQIITDSLGTGGDAVPADYDGDGYADLALWKNNEAKFVLKKTSNSLIAETNFGLTNDKPVVGDYDGDGRADLAVWRPTDNIWYILNSINGQVTYVPWGVFSTDIPVPGDYDADGKTDVAVWRSSGSQVGWWFIRKSSDGQTRNDLWGIANDIPVPVRW